MLYSCYFEARQFSKVIGLGLVCLETRPKDVEVLTLVGAAYYWLHYYKKAKDFCGRAIRINPEYWYAHSILALVFRKLGKPDLALVEAKMTLKLNSTCDNARFVKITCLEYLSRFDELENFLGTLAVGGVSKDYVYRACGIVNLRKGLVKEAIFDFKQELLIPKAEPKNDINYFITRLSTNPFILKIVRNRLNYYRFRFCFSGLIEMFFAFLVLAILSHLSLPTPWSLIVVGMNFFLMMIDFQMVMLPALFYLISILVYGKELKADFSERVFTVSLVVTSVVVNCCWLWLVFGQLTLFLTIFLQFLIATYLGIPILNKLIYPFFRRW